jgi:Tol biopolymer transport system component
VVGALVKLLLDPGPAKARVMAQEGQVYQDATDQNGDYEFSGLPAGLYQMQVDAPGQLPWGTDLDLRGGGAVVQDARLWPPAGQMAVFLSSATDLIPGDTADDYADIYLAHAGGGIEKISNTPEGQNGGDSLLPALSASNRFIVFESWGQLVPEDQNDSVDVYRFDRETGTLTCLTVDPNFNEGCSDEGDTCPSISGDGRFTVFAWNSTGAFEDKQIFLHDAQTGEFTRVSIGLTNDGIPDGRCEFPVISAFGRYIAFESFATNLVPYQISDEHFFYNVFVYDRLTGTTVLASPGINSEIPDDHSFESSISADGRLVVFNSNATNLLADPSPSGMIYVRDMVEKTTTMVSVDNEGNPATHYCYRAMISGNGRYVTFDTGAALVPEDTNPYNSQDVYIRDLQEGTTTLVSWNAAGTKGGDYSSFTQVLSFDGTYALFESWANDLLPGGVSSEDPSAHRQVYVRDLVNGLNALVSHTPANTPGNGSSGLRW